MPRRDRVGRRSPLARWSRRVLGVIGTAAVLAVGAATASMVLTGDDDRVVGEAPAATPGAAGGAGRALAERRSAVRELRRRGYAAVDLADYEADHLLRVLVGEPAGDTPPGLRAFFFVDGEYVGRDAAAPSGKLRPGRQLEREITLVYTLYEPGDRACCPHGGDTRVHFRWTGGKLEPRERIPPAARRMPPG